MSTVYILYFFSGFSVPKKTSAPKRSLSIRGAPVRASLAPVQVGVEWKFTPPQNLMAGYPKWRQKLKGDTQLKAHHLWISMLDFWSVDWIDPFEDVPKSWQKARKIVLHFGKCSSLDGCHFFIFSTVWSKWMKIFQAGWNHDSFPRQNCPTQKKSRSFPRGYHCTAKGPTVPMPLRYQHGYGSTFAAITGLAALQGDGGQLKLMCFPTYLYMYII